MTALSDRQLLKCSSVGPTARAQVAMALRGVPRGLLPLQRNSAGATLAALPGGGPWRGGRGGWSAMVAMVNHRGLEPYVRALRGRQGLCRSWATQRSGAVEVQVTRVALMS